MIGATISTSPGDSAPPLQMPAVKPEPAPMIGATMDEEVEHNGHEGSAASSIPQALASQDGTPQADGSDPTPMIATPEVMGPTEDTGLVSVGQALDNASEH
jgi:hypothetical protein